MTSKTSLGISIFQQKTDFSAKSWPKARFLASSQLSRYGPKLAGFPSLWIGVKTAILHKFGMITVVKLRLMTCVNGLIIDGRICLIIFRGTISLIDLLMLEICGRYALNFFGLLSNFTSS